MDGAALGADTVTPQEAQQLIAGLDRTNDSDVWGGLHERADMTDFYDAVETVAGGDGVGVDAVALTAHDVVAVWETASGGTARGAVFVRGLGPGARWRRTDVEGDILRLGLVRPVFDRLRPRAVGPETVTLVTEGANGMTADPVELSLPGVS